MNILVIGNGFDLAHGLPTKYTDFLEWVKAEYALYIKFLEEKGKIVTEIDQVKVDWAIKTYPSKIDVEAVKDENIQKEIWRCISKNIWVDYFLNKLRYLNENWIDFESEIRKVIRSIDADMYERNLDNQIDKLSNQYLEYNYLYTGIDSALYENGKRRGKQSISFKRLRDILYHDLNRFIRVFEIYLTGFVEKIDCKLVSPDIRGILPKEVMKFNGNPVYDGLYILSFNYTNTYQRLYADMAQGSRYFEKHIDYIHGKADINNTVESNNMVLGIDEYLPEDRKNTDLEFITFKKFYQRIYKQTGCKYKEWVDEIEKGWRDEAEESKIEIRKCISRGNLKSNKIHNLYIFGHSLDVTDKDILRDLILHDNVHTTIFYYNRDVMGQQISNLVKAIGQDELIRRTGGSAKTIEFKQQQDMQIIEEK